MTLCTMNCNKEMRSLVEWLAFVALKPEAPVRFPVGELSRQFHVRKVSAIVSLLLKRSVLLPDSNLLGAAPPAQTPLWHNVKVIHETGGQVTSISLTLCQCVFGKQLF